MLLNFTNCTLMTGFVLQGHICPTFDIFYFCVSLQCCALQPIAHNYVEFMNAVANQRHSDESSLEQRSFESFLNMCYCLCLCSCETSSVITQVLFLFKVHMSPNTVQIPGCVLAPPFLSMMHQEVTCVNLRQPGIPERISHQSASINDGFLMATFSKNYCYFVMKCHISGKNVVV